MSSDALMFLVAEDHDVGLILLIDGLIDIRCVPSTAFKSFISIYVSDVRWLSGAMIFDEAVIPMLDVEALTTHGQADADRHESMGEVFIIAHSLKERA